MTPEDEARRWFAARMHLLYIDSRVLRRVYIQKSIYHAISLRTFTTFEKKMQASLEVQGAPRLSSSSSSPWSSVRLSLSQFSQRAPFTGSDSLLQNARIFFFFLPLQLLLLLLLTTLIHTFAAWDPIARGWCCSVLYVPVAIDDVYSHTTTHILFKDPRDRDDDDSTALCSYIY